MEEADPNGDDGISVTEVRLNPSSQVVPEFKGVSEDSFRLSEFARHDFSTVCRLVAVLCGPQIDVEGTVTEAIARAARLRIPPSPIWLERWSSPTSIAER